MSSFINQPYIGGQEYILILHNRFHSKKAVGIEKATAKKAIKSILF